MFLGGGEEAAEGAEGLGAAQAEQALHGTGPGFFFDLPRGLELAQNVGVAQGVSHICHCKIRLYEFTPIETECFDQAASLRRMIFV